MHPALLIFLVSLVNQTITWFGKEKLQEVCYRFYSGIVNYSSSRKLSALKKELFATRQQMNATSAQDEFSKWAKLRRKTDKLTGQVEEQSTSRRVLTKTKLSRQDNSSLGSFLKFSCLY
ncbi:GET complex subunit get1 [Malassezia psittaci]|uniref:GET complex subunit get1 n=1 Tax=Malassezia psittaci TaxID=1821823 RepID=A0AAF0JFI7_9BASI|nr:GET complex subunit get1 [Malassezia psittaci]